MKVQNLYYKNSYAEAPSWKAHCVKKISKTPLSKVLEILKNFFQEVFKWGSGQSPEVFPKVFYAL